MAASRSSLFALLLALSLFVSSVRGIPLIDFYLFGDAAGDDSVGPTDDGSSGLITLNRVFPFYASDHFMLVVNNNGLISFGKALPAYTPLPFPLNATEADSGINTELQLIAPFWGDVDTNEGGEVWFRESSSQADRDRAQREIRIAFPAQASSFVPRLVFIATWDSVGYYDRNNDKTNTFQCILVSDGFMSFVIFLYADGLIQWTTGDASEGMGGLGGIPAQVGFNAGDRTNFASHPYSQTNDILNIASSSVPEGRAESGMLVYRVDGRVIGECLDTVEAELSLNPRLGNQLGGTGVLITGLCTQPGDSFACIFDGAATRGSVVDGSTVLCPTPVMTTPDSVDVVLRRLRRGGNPRSVTVTSTFTTLSPIRAHQVGFSVATADEEMQLYFRANDVVNLTWMPREMVSDSIRESAENLTMKVELYQQIPFTGRGRPNWAAIAGSEVTGIDNSGTAQYTIPEGLMLQDCPDQSQICPVAFRLSVSFTVTGNSRATELAIWSAVAYLQSDSATMESLASLCAAWSTPPEFSNNRITTSVLKELVACPPTQAQAIVDNRFREETAESAVTTLATGYAQAAMKFYHPASSVCYLEILMEGSREEGQECCYNDDGNLVTNQPAGGSVDKMSPLVNFNDHSMDDLLPYAFCCRGSELCRMYEELRPSLLQEAEPYQLPVPAVGLGDPHIVTLDGLKYTFNGKGEFVLMQTYDRSFTVQGRMEQAQGGGSGTIFTSIAARQVAEGVGPGSVVVRTVEFQLSRLRDELEVLVDGRRLNFAELSEQNFPHVVVTDRGNNTAVAEFSGGSIIRIQVANGIMSRIEVTLARRYRSLTLGLMGNYNGDRDDDLVPRNSFIPIPSDAGSEEIFEFGSTWMLDDASESLFAYNRPGESFESFRDTSFIPAFVPVFDNPELEAEADEICGDDQFCLFDIAATSNVDIGMATMNSVREFDRIMELAEPIVCDPPCVNGVCVATNNCSCSVGFSGETCTERIERECDVNMCRNNGTCVRHVGSLSCDCPEGFIGIFCQEREPPFSLRLINSSPRAHGDYISVEFTPSKPLRSARCSMISTTNFSRETRDCSSGRVRFRRVSSGLHRIKITAIAANTRERAVERRAIFICDEEVASCGVTLINEGVTVEGDCATVQFTSCGMVDSFMCRLNRDPFKPCRSPMRFCSLEVRSHRLQIVPLGLECKERGRLSASFEVI